MNKIAKDQGNSDHECKIMRSKISKVCGGNWEAEVEKRKMGKFDSLLYDNSPLPPYPSLKID